METFTSPKEFEEYLFFNQRKKEALKDFYSELKKGLIDRPIIDILKDFNKIPYCFTMQGCYGHFVHKKQKDSHNLESISRHKQKSNIKYRIAYLAIGLDNNKSGKKMYNDLEKVKDINPDYIQFGSADWFNMKCPNNFILQVEPERDKYKDTSIVEKDEALKLEKAKTNMFDELRKIAKKHLGKL